MYFSLLINSSSAFHIEVINPNVLTLVYDERSADCTIGVASVHILYSSFHRKDLSQFFGVIVSSPIPHFTVWISSSFLIAINSATDKSIVQNNSLYLAFSTFAHSTVHFTNHSSFTFSIHVFMILAPLVYMFCRYGSARHLYCVPNCRRNVDPCSDFVPLAGKVLSILSLICACLSGEIIHSWNSFFVSSHSRNSHLEKCSNHDIRMNRLSIHFLKISFVGSINSFRGLFPITFW